MCRYEIVITRMKILMKYEIDFIYMKILMMV
jgi:hypothetical protein